MEVMRVVIILLLLTLLQSCVSDMEPCGKNRRFYEVNSVIICPVSLINLIATPERFDGKVVAVSGFYASDFELSALFLHRDDLLLRNRTNAIWLGVSSNDVLRDWAQQNDNSGEEWISKLVGSRMASGKYVTVFGIFSSGISGHLGAYNGKVDLMMDFHLVE